MLLRLCEIESVSDFRCGPSDLHPSASSTACSVDTRCPTMHRESMFSDRTLRLSKQRPLTALIGGGGCWTRFGPLCVSGAARWHEHWLTHNSLTLSALCLLTNRRRAKAGAMYRLIDRSDWGKRTKRDSEPELDRKLSFSLQAAVTSLWCGSCSQPQRKTFRHCSEATRIYHTYRPILLSFFLTVNKQWNALQAFH